MALEGLCTDLVEQRRWIEEDEYKLALARIMLGPLGAQLAIALGYFQHGVPGATAAGLSVQAAIR